MRLQDQRPTGFLTGPVDADYDRGIRMPRTERGSAGMTLEPGDILATGTPSGVGAASGAYLKVGDQVEAEIDGLGVLTNPVVAPGSSKGR